MTHADDLVVVPDASASHRGRLYFGGRDYPCALGKAGVTAHKREGDNKTPIGRFALRELFYRADRLDVPRTVLPVRAIEEDDGWCDDPAHADYNRRVRVPFAASHEKLWRADAVYDLIVPMGYNDDPPVAGRGSAIFLHVARQLPGDDFQGTEGCVALAREDLLTVLADLQAESRIHIRPPDVD